jgi:hypothetical protein
MHTVKCEIEQGREVSSRSVGVTRVWQPRARIPQLIKEWMYHGIDGRETLGGGVFEEFRDQVNRIGVGLAEHL